MESVAIIVILSVAILGLIGLIIAMFVLQKQRQKSGDIDLNIFDKIIKNNFDRNDELIKQRLEMIREQIEKNNKSMLEFMTHIANLMSSQSQNNEQRINELVKNVDNKQEKMLVTLSQNLKEIQSSNEKKLDEMRATVDEKLSTTLEKRLNESVKIINQGIETVSQGIGEMKNLTNGMNDFKKMITNVKTRGGWGEVQLGTLLEQVLSPNQYESQVNIKDSERVDYVIKLPGKDDGTIYLPIDAKFPMEDYLRLCKASEEKDIKEVEVQSKNLERRIKDEAKKIKEKYICLPKTTDFGVMYLPVEGLYAEVLRKSDLIDTIQREYKILICGPTTLTALLNSLQMGFKTVAIEKRSSEIWNMLGVFKQEFVKFVELLSKTRKKLDEASDTIDFATKKTKTIERKLKEVSIDESVKIDNE